MLRKSWLLALGLVSLLMAGCNDDQQASSSTGQAATVTPADPIEWKMVTTWPKNFPGLGTGANHLAELINEMSGGRLQVKVYGAKELVDALEVFDAVTRGTAEMGHGVSYYWKGKVPAAQLFSAAPFGFTAQELDGWIYQGGGLELWNEVYEPFGVMAFPGGNTGTQMGGWFNKEINSVADLQGLKMRIPGLGGEVLERAGGAPVLLAGSEIYTAMQTGAIDATEWVGPYNDQAFGLNQVADYYYYPGWHEPGSAVEILINKAAFEALPADLQSIVRNATKAANVDMMAEYMARNFESLNQLIAEGVDVRPFPDDVLKLFRQLSEQVLEEAAAEDEQTARVYASLKSFLDSSIQYSKVAEQAYLNARSAE